MDYTALVGSGYKSPPALCDINFKEMSVECTGYRGAGQTGFIRSTMSSIVYRDANLHITIQMQ